MPRFYIVLALYFIFILGHHQTESQSTGELSTDSTLATTDTTTTTPVEITSTVSTSEATMVTHSDGTTTAVSEDPFTIDTGMSSITYENITTDNETYTSIEPTATTPLQTTTITNTTGAPASEAETNLGLILGLSLGLGIPAVLAATIGIVFYMKKRGTYGNILTSGSRT